MNEQINNLSLHIAHLRSAWYR